MTGWIIATIASLILALTIWTNGMLMGEKDTSWKELVQLRWEYTHLVQKYEGCKHRRRCP